MASGTGSSAFAFCTNPKRLSSDYVKLYNGDKDTLTQSLGHIQQVSTDILSGITPP
jgi:hypothetical protein